MNIHNHGILRRFLVMLCVIMIFTVAVTENVSLAARTPRLNIKTLSLVKGKSYKLRLYNTSSDHTISFESEDSSVAAITNVRKNSCNIKAKSTGQTTVTAYITNNTTEEITELTCKVTVTPPAVTVKFCKKKIKLQLGMSKKAKISIKPSTSLELPRFFSDDPEIASVSSNGTVTANKVGKTSIRVSIGNGKASICKIVVKDKSNKKNNDNDESENDIINNNDTLKDTDKDTQSQEPAAKPTATPAPGINTPDSPKTYPKHDDKEPSLKDNQIKPRNDFYYR